MTVNKIIGFFSLLLVIIFIYSGENEPEVITSNVSTPLTTLNNTVSKPSTTTSTTSTTVVKQQKQLKPKLQPNVNSVNELVPSTFWNLEVIVKDEFKKWDEVHNGEEDCDDSALYSCGLEDPTTKLLFQNAENNSLLISVVLATQKFVSVFDFYIDERNDCEDVINWLKQQDQTIFLEIGQYNIEDCFKNDLFEFSNEIDKMRFNIATLVQEMYCQATSREMKWAIHRIIVGYDLDTSSILRLGIIYGASWSYCPTDNEYPPEDEY